jgi:hypothetical protein
VPISPPPWAPTPRPSTSAPRRQRGGRGADRGGQAARSRRLWLVEKDGAKLYVLGSAPPLPHQLKWSSPRLDRALDKASLVLVPPEASVGPLQVAGFVLKLGGGLRQPMGKKLERPAAARPEGPLRRTTANRPARARALQELEAGRGGLLLLSDFRQAAGLSEAKPVSTVERMAKARKLKVKAWASTG